MFNENLDTLNTVMNESDESAKKGLGHGLFVLGVNIVAFLLGTVLFVLTSSHKKRTQKESVLSED